MAVSVPVPDADLACLGVRSPAQLRQLLAAAVRAEPDAELTDVRLQISEVPYDLSALTTRGRYRIHGDLRCGGSIRPIRVFVKVVQSWALTPEFQFVPEAFRALAAAQLPWRVEPGVYGSALAQSLPPGLRMPSTYGVVELDGDSAAIWMEDVDTTSEPEWTLAEHAVAARALGSFAVSPAVAGALRVIETEIAGLDLRTYTTGRVALRLAPMLRSDHLWEHPGVAAHFGSLRARLMDLLDRLPALLDELDGLPTGICHGDACTRNLLRSPAGGPLTLIDFGFVRHAPLGCDLGQLIFGEIQLGERSVDDLFPLWSSCTTAYLAGLRAVGCDAEPAAVLRGTVIAMAVFNAVGAVPVEDLHRWDSRSGDAFFAARAAMAEFVLDQLGD